MGNNMFQIGTVLTLAYNRKQDHVLPLWEYQHVFDFPEWVKFSRDAYPNLTRYKEPCYGYREIPEGDLLLDGYFQSGKYLDRDLISQVFTFNSQVQHKVQVTYHHLLENGPLVALGVRRKDYLNNPFHSVATDGFYRHALEMAQPFERVVIFSDDIPWCREAFGRDKRFVFTNPNSMNYEDLYLMTLCDKFIIPNSTYHWWGAWLSKKCQQVICPDHWFGPGGPEDYQDIYCDGWTKISCEGKLIASMGYEKMFVCFDSIT